MNQPQQHLRAGLPLVIVLSGLALNALLPLGFLLGIDSNPYRCVFIGHLILLLVGILATAVLFLRLARASRWSAFLPSTVLAVFAVVIVLAGLTPIVDPQAVRDELFVAHSWLLDGSISEIKWHEPSYAPGLLKLAYAGLLLFGLEALTPLYHFSHLLLLCGMVLLFMYTTTKEAEVAVRQHS